MSFNKFICTLLWIGYWGLGIVITFGDLIPSKFGLFCAYFFAGAFWLERRTREN